MKSREIRGQVRKPMGREEAELKPSEGWPEGRAEVRSKDTQLKSELTGGKKARETGATVSADL